MGTKLDTLPVEIIREIYRHLLCPGIITVHQLPRDKQENENGQVASEGREMRIEASQNCNALGYNRLLDQALSTQWDVGQALQADFREVVELGLPRAPKYLTWQRSRLRDRTFREKGPRLMHVGNSGIGRIAVDRVQKQAWCACVLCRYKPRCCGSVPEMLETTLVCKTIHDAVGDIVFLNVFRFHRIADLRRFSPLLGEEQRGLLRAVEIKTAVLMLL